MRVSSLRFEMKATGHFFRELSSKKEVGEIEISKQTASITSHEKRISENVKIASIQSRKDIYLENGFLFSLDEPLTADQEALHLHEINKAILWLELFSFRKALVFSFILLAGLFLIRLGLTSATQMALLVFPDHWEGKIGDNAYATFKSVAFEDSQLPPVRIAKLREETTKIILLNNLRESEVVFHASDIIGANALAFPGGPIVVTDGLVEILESDALVLAVIAHELAHIERRHSLHQIVELIGIAAVGSVLLGSNDTLIEEASVIAANLWATKNSREFEKESDLLALTYLETAGLTGNSFLKAIEKLTEHYCGLGQSDNIQNCMDGEESGWFSTHPSGAERRNYLRRQAAE